MQEIFEKAICFLEEKLNNSASIDAVEKKYRLEHSLRVANIACFIAKREGQDVFITTLAAILHDVGKFDTEENIEHGRVSADVALVFLKTLGISKKQMDDVHFCIASHVDGYAGYEYENIAEADTVSDADNIDRFGVYRIYQKLAWDNVEALPALEGAEKYSIIAEKTERFRDANTLSTSTANEMFRKNLDIQIDFFKNLAEELKQTDCSVLCP